MPSKVRKVGIVLMTSLGCMACALSQELSSQTLKMFMKDDVDFSDAPFQAWADLCSPVGTMMGCLLCWIPLHFLGRRSTLELLSSPILIFGCCLTFTFNHLTRPNPLESTMPYIHYSFILGICLQGISCGLTFTASPIYILETIGNHSCKSSSTGLLILTTQLSTAIGILVANVFPVENETYFYHLLPAGCQIICLLGFYFLPESPRWLLLRKLRVEDAKTALRFLKGHNSADYDVCKELAEYQTDEEKFKPDIHNQIQSVTLYLHPLLVAAGLTCMWHLYGVYLYDFYAAWAFKFAGISNKWNINTTVVSLCIRTISLSVSIAMFLVSRGPISHCVFLLFSSGLVTIALTVTGTCFYGFSQGDTWTANVSWLPLAAFLLFQCAFWFGPGSQAYITAILITPIPLRPTISSLAGAIYWLASMLGSRLVMPMINIFHPFGAFWFFAGMSAIGLIFVMCSVMPEINRREIIAEERAQSLVM